MKRASEEFSFQHFPPEGGRKAPPIWLPPPPPLSSEENSATSSPTSLRRQQDNEEEDDEGYDEDVNSSQQRWGRSNFTTDEINVLDTPLPTHLNPPREKLGVRILRILLVLLPALCFTGAVHLINDIMTDFKLFSASFSMFQGLFWPSLVFFLVDLITGNEKVKGDKCKLFFWVLLHSFLSAIAAIAQLLSIQRLNISVSLALSLSSSVFVILLLNINREKKFSKELTLCAILAYLGFIVVGLPAMLNNRGKYAEELTAGVLSSLTAASCAVPASFLLYKLRQEKVFDSLLGLSFAFQGSLLSLVVKLWMDTSLTRIDIDAMSVGWAAGLTSLVILGAVFTYLEGRFGGGSRRTGLLRLRFLVFIFSCFWEVFRQGIWNTFPDVYDIIGSILVTLAFLLAVGFEAWMVHASKEAKKIGGPLPWLFSRKKVMQ